MTAPWTTPGQRWRLLAPAGAVAVKVPSGLLAVRRTAAELRTLPAGTPVVLLDHRRGGRLRTRRITATGALVVDRPYEETVELNSRGLLLIPSVFAWPRTWAMFDAPWQPALVYPARGVGSLWAPPGTPAPDALAALIGRRRAEILTELPASTRELAERLGASPGGVSEHLGVMRAAGLIHGRREGREVRYVRTDAGDALLRT